MNEIIRTLRAQAWERAKGELRAMLQTFWGANEDEQFGRLNGEVEGFISRVEDGGLYE